MKKRFKLLFEWTLGLAGIAVVVGLIAFENQTERDRRCQSIEVEIENPDEGELITEREILNVLSEGGKKPLEGRFLSHIDLAEVEKDIRSLGNVENCEVIGDLKGVIHVNAVPQKAIARVVSETGKHQLMCASGKTYDLGKNYREKVVLLSGDFFSSNPDLENQKELLALLDFIQKDEFWKAQVTRIDISRNGEITMLTALGNQRILFGKAENVESKFKRLLVFYEKILPSKEWEDISIVNLKYKNQIVAKKA